MLGQFLRVLGNFEIFHDRLRLGRWSWGNHITTWNLVASCSLPWSGSLYEIATLSWCWHFLISASRGCCRSLNVLCVNAVIIVIIIPGFIWNVATTLLIIHWTLGENDKFFTLKIRNKISMADVSNLILVWIILYMELELERRERFCPRPPWVNGCELQQGVRCDWCCIERNVLSR